MANLRGVVSKWQHSRSDDDGVHVGVASKEGGKLLGLPFEGCKGCSRVIRRYSL